MQSIHNSLHEAYMKNSQGTGISKSRVKEDFQLCKKWDLLLSMEIAQKARRTNMKRARQEALAPRKTKAKELQLAKRLEHSIICRQSNKTLKHNREDIYVKRNPHRKQSRKREEIQKKIVI